MGAPQIVVIVLIMIAGGIYLLNHDSIRSLKYNYNFIAWALISVAQIGALYWGGFFG